MTARFVGFVVARSCAILVAGGGLSLGCAGEKSDAAPVDTGGTSTLPQDSSAPTTPAPNGTEATVPPTAPGCGTLGVTPDVGTTSSPPEPPANGSSGAPNSAGGADGQSAGGANGAGGMPSAAGGLGAGGEVTDPVIAPDLLDQSGEVPTLALPGGNLKLEVCAPNIVRVMFAPDETFFERTTLITAPKRCDATTPWGLIETAESTTLLTSQLKARVDLASGNVTFLDGEDNVLLAERARSMTAATIQGEDVFNVRQQWEAQDEALYGLGQHQQNLMNIKGTPLSLVQYNVEIVVPFFVSSQGYGILWDNTSWTRWGDLTELTTLSDGGTNYQGNFTAESAGEYLFQTWASGDIKLYIDDELVIDHWRQGWLPGRDYAKVTLDAGQTIALRMEFEPDIDVEIATLSYKPPAPDEHTSLWSEVADGIDYTFVRGPALDTVIAGYRQLSGEAPMMPKWALGFWQCRERYETAQEIIDVLEGFRSRNIPIDNIVQDWEFWVPGTWGSHEFDPSRYPDPAGWVQQIHDDYNAQLMISVWPKFHAGTANYQALDEAGYLYDINKQENILDFTGVQMSYYDAFDVGAREMFWSQMNEDLFSLGIDAWWMDATEPEVVEGPYPSPEEHRSLYQTHMHPTAMGSGSRMLNAYSLVNSQAVYEGQRSVAADQRVFILTRSSFAGQQRYASASWSGDISTTWTAFRKQIPAGLNFVISGVPYWTMDVGGFAEYPGFPGDGVEWEELNTRWFQYGTFTPLLRVHGQDDRTGPREMWNFSDATYQVHLKFDRLRYRLMPYIYSLAGEVTQRAGTMMRPLVMDFRTDSGVYEIWDQYMFGPAFLVSPVTEFQARSRAVYLPATNGGWYDFWTGGATAGGQTLNAAAPLEAMPLYVRAGSIIPVGPELQYSDEVAADPITLYVYSGANGSFTLYEDDGTSYAYENGEFAEVPLRWDDATSTLTLGARCGQFTGMLAERTFQVVKVSAENPVGFDLDAAPTTVSVQYDGTPQEIAVP
jgi:alpha-D-xyloside xylohydrolase